MTIYFGDIAAFGSKQVVVTVRVNSSAQVGDEIKNRGYLISGGEQEFEDKNPPKVDPVTAAGVLTKKSDVDVVKVGDSFVYTIKAENTSSQVWQNVVIEDELPSQVTYVIAYGDGTITGSTKLTINFGNIEVGKSKSIYIKVQVNSSAKIGDVIRNTITLKSSNSPDMQASDNEPPVVQETTGGDCVAISLRKTVGGKFIIDWFNDRGINSQTRTAIANDITFNVYSVSGNNGSFNTSQTPYAVGKIDVNTGYIVFTPNTFARNSWFAIDEVLGGTASMYLEKSAPVYFYVTGKGSVQINGGFDYNATYTIINGYSNYIKNIQYGQNNQFIYNNGDVFPIAVRNVNNNLVFPSFCAYQFSEQFAGYLGCSGYKTADLANSADCLSAFNYIEDKYGNVDTNRVISQVVTWVLINAVDVNSSQFAAANLTASERTAILDVVSHYKGYKGNGRIIDVVYMVCRDHSDFRYCQPQYVPVYGNFDNRAK
jgi:uncharacterized repeat protein (TIGR01451 family)